jgi:hypothetical protein
MASSYTSLLKFNQPALGDAGWGTSINNGFTAMVEQAMTGVVTKAVTVAGPNTLGSIANGVSSEARNQFIVLTGTLASPASLTVPAGATDNYKLYFVKNTASDAVTITAGGTGVVVPAGKSMILRVTGTDVEETIGHISGTPTAATASFGTNTTQLATTAFVQAALQALHPVGSIYINATNATNPGTLLGFGTWVAFGAGRVPVGFDSTNVLFDTAEETGGSADAVVVSHTHTITDPGHSHTTTIPTSAVGNSAQSLYSTNSAGTSSTITSSTATTGISVNTAGSSGTNANYQPYITVYMWKRTA